LLLAGILQQMPDASDMELVREFARDNSETAFAEIVRRHIALVYSVARRCTGNDGDAKDVTQAVFIVLARKANSLGNKTILPGWLYETTRFTAARLLRTQARRAAREQEAYMQSTLNDLSRHSAATAEAENIWTQLAPHLETAMGKLSAADRTLLVLRFYENKTALEASKLLGIGEDAAHKRLTRAIEKLRKLFVKRGVTLSATTIAGAVSANSVHAAPAGLINSILTATSGITATVGLTMMHKILIAGFAAAAISSGIYSIHLQKQVVALQQQQTSLNQQIAQLSQKRDDAKNQLSAAQMENEQLRTNENELLRLRGEAGVLRRQLAEKNHVKAAMFESNTNSYVPQIHIKTQFLTMPADAGMGGVANLTGVLTSENASNILKELQLRDDVKILAAPQTVSTSGRQIQMRVTQLVSVVTNFCLEETNGVSSITPQIEPVETGPILNAMPRILSDGHTIELPVVASVTEFLGYAPSTNTTPAYNSSGQEVDLPTVSPQFHVQQATNLVNLLDGQTLAFALDEKSVPADATFQPDKKTLVFITATIIDTSGNRVHTDAGNYTNLTRQAVAQ